MAHITNYPFGSHDSFKKYYEAVVYEKGESDFENYTMSTSKFDEKLKPLYKDDIAIHNSASRKAGKIVFLLNLLWLRLFEMKALSWLIVNPN